MMCIKECNGRPELSSLVQWCQVSLKVMASFEVDKHHELEDEQVGSKIGESSE